jgi:2'-5' RNA ligase
MTDRLVRSFAAFEIPSRIQESIGIFCDQMRVLPEAEPLRWVRPEILHMTVRFFGDLDRKRLDRARRAIRSLDGTWVSPDLVFGAIGGFPNLRRPSVVWLGIRDADGKLKALAEETDRAIRVTGFGPADKPFVAHLTLARVARGRPGPDLERLTAGLTPPADPLTITSITLFESILRGAKGPEYIPLEVARPRAREGAPRSEQESSSDVRESPPRARRTGHVPLGSEEGEPADG